jgi:hypothetical protein
MPETVLHDRTRIGRSRSLRPRSDAMSTRLRPQLIPAQVAPKARPWLPNAVGRAADISMPPNMIPRITSWTGRS